MKSTIFLLLLNSLMFFDVHANVIDDSLQLRLDAYNRKHPVNSLYVHLDRNEYAPGDTVWLKAYMMTPMPNEVLFTRLIDKKKNLIIEKQFPVQDIRSNGDFCLPDTLSEGDYRFYAYMDRTINFDAENIFVQPIRVSKNIKKTLSIEAYVTDTNKLKINGKVEVVVKVKGGVVDKVKGLFNLYVSDRVYKTGKISTNDQGETTIQFSYPKLDDTESLRCEIVLNRGTESANLSLNLRHEGNAVHVEAFPEGGRLVSGILNTVVFETKDNSKSPTSVKLMLLHGQDVVGSVTTNRQGLGEIEFVPVLDSEPYTVKVFDVGTAKIHPLPCPIEQSGVAVELDVKGDNANVKLTNVGNKGVLRLLLRSFEKLVWSDTLTLGHKEYQNLDLPIKGLPPGLLTLIVCNESGKPIAERLFMNKSTQEYKVVVGTTKSVSKDFQTVGITMDVTDSKGNPVLANLSVAVVDKSTINLSEYRNILQSYYFHSLRNPNNRNFDENSSDFDLRLKTTNWERFRWDSIYTYTSKSPLELLANTGGLFFKLVSDSTKSSIKTNILEVKTRSWSYTNPASSGRKIIDTLVVTRSGINRNTSYYPFIERIDSVKKEQDDYLFISPKTLLCKSNEDKLIYLNQPFFNGYNMEFYDFATEFERNVKYTHILEYKRPFNTIGKYEAPPVKVFNKTVQLKDIDIVASGKNLRYRLSDLIGDYFCFNTVINCPNHTEIEGRPSIGCVYSCEVSLNNNINIDYNGPGKPFTNSPRSYKVGERHYLPLRSVTLPNEFYHPGLSDTTYLRGDMRPTIYWNPNLNTLSKGQASFEFNLSTERKSEFLIVIQGVDVKTFKPIYCTYLLKL